MAALVGDMQVVLRENNTAVLVILVIILRVIYLLSIFESEADPAEIGCFWPRVLESLRWKLQENIFLRFISVYVCKLVKRNL